ncbi:MAG: four helix bundle protein [Planctomycetales bacterium]
MILSGYVHEDLEGPAGDVREAVVTKERIALTWEEEGQIFHAALRSEDGGCSYEGRFGEFGDEQAGTMAGWCYRSRCGDYLLWVEWFRPDTGYGGTSVFGFEKLDVWQKAVDFTDSIYVATRDFPSEERFGLTSQLRRASVSIAGNIAEGSSRSSSRDFLRFVEIAYGSLMETVSHIAIAQRQGLLSEPTRRVLYDEAERLGRMLSGLRAHLMN